MRVLQLTAENVKCIKVVNITPSRNVVAITGRNAAGKSAVLDCIWWALAGKDAVGSMPIRRGEQQARIQLDLGQIVVTRTFKGDGTTKLTVKAADGAVYPTPQKMLDALLGSLTLTFDPLAFAEMPAKAQFDELRHMVTLDVDLDALDQANERDYTLRTGWNSKKASLTERLKTASADVDLEMDVTPVDFDKLLDRMHEASEHNAAITTEERRRDEIGREIDRLRKEFADISERARALRSQADGLDEKAGEIANRASDAARERNELPSLPEPIDTRELRELINSTRMKNALKDQQVQRRATHTHIADDLESTLAEVEKLTAAMKERTQLKADAIARANMPVAGLSFGNGEVLFNDVPFSQASTAQQIRVGFELAIARNPKLRVIRIANGSLLDDASMAIVAELADERDMQVWIERLAGDSKDVGILLEAGEVVAVDGIPVEAAAV